MPAGLVRTGTLTSAAFAPLAMPYDYVGTGDTTGWGYAGAGGWQSFKGSIDEAAIWNQALTTTQIANLDSAAPAGTTTYVYDSHGNTTTNVDQTMTCDIANRHLATTAAGTTVTYTRDLTDRITQRTVTAGTTTRYGFTGTGDISDVTLNNAGTVLERTISLPGGVLLTKRAAGDVWSYASTHGDITATTNAAGLKQGSTYRYSQRVLPLPLVCLTTATTTSTTAGWVSKNEAPNTPRGCSMSSNGRSRL